MDDAEIDRLRKAIYRSFGNQPHKKKYWLALLEMYGGAGKKPKQGRRPATEASTRGPSLDPRTRSPIRRID